jgi:hypothetical protein
MNISPNIYQSENEKHFTFTFSTSLIHVKIIKHTVYYLKLENSTINHDLQKTGAVKRKHRGRH